MALPAGTRLGPYEITGAIGAGGMGEVYCAKDTRLGRTVAVKVLSAHVAQDPGLRERFEREARTISSLDHPHICALYDIGHEAGVDFLVMQHLEGETLADRLHRGPLPLDQLLTFAVQIADALDKAHRRGIVHRDLKPGNIMLTKTGAKLLDFGLAKAAPVTSGLAAGGSIAATEHALTARGTVLGTIHYMSPEQLEGQEADARSDLFALGAVMYEMATGRRAFDGSNPASVMSSILKDEPASASTVQPLVPPGLDRLIARCLVKDPDERWQSAHDLANDVKWLAGGGERALQTAAAPRRAGRWRAVFTLAGVAAAVGAGVGLGAYLYSPRERAEVVRFGVERPEQAAFTMAAVSQTAQFALSPDGRFLTFVAAAVAGPSRLWVRALDQVEARPLPDTDGASFPFWSPDSRFIGFFAGAKLRIIAAAGGAPKTLADAPGARGGGWSRAGVILFAPAGGVALRKVDASGGPATLVTDFDEKKSQSLDAQYWPSFLPDGRHFLFFGLAARPADRGVYVGSLDSSETRHLVAVDTMAAYAMGHLFFVHQGTLMAQRFDADRQELRGERVVVAERVGFFPNFGHAAFSVAERGVIAHAPSFVSATRMTWFDRGGKPLDAVGSPGVYRDGPKLSLDQRRVVTVLVDEQAGTSDLYVLDLSRRAASRVTFHAATDFFPVWSPDGSRVMFSSDRGGAPDLYSRMSSGAGEEEPIAPRGSFRFPTDWSRDGRFVIYHHSASLQGYDLAVLSVADRTVKPYLSTPFNESQGRLSPDGQWLAYTSDESGKQEVYVQTFPPTGAKWQISTAGGSQPEWRRDGRELFYVSADRKLMAVSVNATPAGFDATVPLALFDARTPEVAAPYFHHYAASADGQRFLVNSIAEDSASLPITVVLNWAAGRRR